MAFIALERRGNGALIAGDRSAMFGTRVALEDGDTDGVYAGWRWDAAGLTVETDRYGFYPIYSSGDDVSWTLATSIDELLARGTSRALDYDALSVFLRVGFFVDDDTPFRAIRAVPPRPRVEMSGTSVQVRGRVPVPRLHSLTRRAAVDAYIDLFRQAMVRRPASASCQLPLSGGRDSRHILFELARQRARPSACVTVEHFPPRGNDDVAVAAELCRRMGVRHVVLRQPGGRRHLEAEKNRLTHYCTDEHAQFVVLSRYLQRETRETYDGIAGDVLSQSSYLNPAALASFSAGDPAAAARYVLDGYGTTVSDRALARLLAPPLLREVPRERAVARLALSIAPHMAAPNPVASFFFWNRTRREVALAPYGLLRDVRVHAPYLDRDLFDLLNGLPASIEMDRTLHTDAIARAYPPYADVPYESRSRQAGAPGRGRATAAALLGTVVRSTRTLHARALLPPLAAALLTGTTTRLWHTSLTFYLAQIADVAASRDR